MTVLTKDFEKIVIWILVAAGFFISLESLLRGFTKEAIINSIASTLIWTFIYLLALTLIRRSEKKLEGYCKSKK